MDTISCSRLRCDIEQKSYHKLFIGTKIDAFTPKNKHDTCAIFYSWIIYIHCKYVYDVSICLSFSFWISKQQWRLKKNSSSVLEMSGEIEINLKLSGWV